MSTHNSKEPLSYEGRSDCHCMGFVPTITWNDRKTVQVGWVKVAGVLQESGLAAMAEQHQGAERQLRKLGAAIAVYADSLAGPLM